MSNFRKVFYVIALIMVLECDSKPERNDQQSVESERMSGVRSRRAKVGKGTGDVLDLFGGVGSVSGVDPMRMDDSGLFEDGESCITGQVLDILEAYYANQAQERFRAGYEQKTGFPFAHIYTVGQLEGLNMRITQRYGSKCRSRICTLNVTSTNLVCGPPVGMYPDGSSCIDGTKPLTQSAFKQTGLPRHTPYGEGKNLTDEDIKKENNRAIELYGKSCKSGKCFYHVHRGSYICGSSSIKPFLILFFVTLLPIW